MTRGKPLAPRCKVLSSGDASPSGEPRRATAASKLYLSRSPGSNRVLRYGSSSARQRRSTRRLL
eukprot:6203119-Pleurochrysis_carterae.AAC.2